MPKQIWVVGDSMAMAETLRRTLSGQRYVVKSVGREQALHEAASGLPDLIILDGRSVPDQAVELARRLRPQASSAPVVAVVPSIDVARDDSGTIYRDHVPAEDDLVALLGEEQTPNEAHVLRVGKIALDLDAHRLDVDGEVSTLTPKQFRLLSLFMSHPGQVLTRKQLMKEVWDTDYTGDTRTLDVHIHWVREKLGDVPGRPKYLQTVRRVGYRFVDPTEQAGPGAESSL
jgi:DNA-binding response OmpR family regulator